MAGERSTEIGRWPGSHWAERLRATIERARIDLRRGNVNDVVETLEPYIGDSTPQDGRSRWLISLALALCGRALEERDGEGAGRQMLGRAVSLVASSDIDAATADPEDAADIAAALRLLGRAQQAVELILGALQKVETVPWRVRLELGRGLHLTGKEEEAVVELTTALNDKPGEPFILLERARCRAALGDVAETVRDATEAAVGFISRGRLGEAAEAAAEAMRGAPDDRAALSLHAEVLLRQGKVEDALESATRAAEDASTNVAAHAIRASALFQLGRFNEALTAAGAVLEQQPADLQALGISADALLRIGRLDEALPLLERALAAEPDAIGLVAMRGRVFAALDRTDEAERDLALVLEANPGDIEAAVAMADLLVRTDRLDDAIPLLERAAATAPADADTLSYLGEALRLAGRLEEARARLDTAVALDPSHAVAVGTRGQVLLALDLVDEAMTDLHRAHELDQALPWVLWSLGGALVSVGRITDAVQVFSDYVVKAPERGRAELDVGVFLTDLNYADEALPFLRRAAEFAADEALPALLVALHATDQLAEVARLGRGHHELPAIAAAVVADSLRMTGEEEEAIALADRVIAAKPGDVFALTVRGEARRSLGQLDAAEIDLRSALNADPDNISACGALGRVLRAQGRFAEALPLLEAAAGNSAVYEAELADTLMYLGRAEEALAHSERAVNAQPDDAFALSIQGQVLRVLSRTAEALEAIDQSLAIAPRTAWVRAERALLLSTLDRDDEALGFAKALVEDEPGDANALATYGLVLNAADQPTAALAALDRSLQLSPTAWAQATRGDVLQGLGRNREAAAALRKLIESGESDDMWTRERFAEACVRMEPPDAHAALAALEKLDNNDSGVVRALSLRGDAHLLIGQRIEARNDYELGIERAQAIGSPDYWTLYATGWCMLKLGQIQDAARNLMRALDQRRVHFMQLDLGLVMLHSERPARALAEYRRGFKLTNALADDEHRRSVLREALQDLDRALGVENTLKPSEVVDEVRAMIVNALQEAQSDKVTH
jgi:tetratricopeptide (TPR) repeat protein